MSNPNGQNPYPGYIPQGAPPLPGEPARPMYPGNPPSSPYPAAAAPVANRSSYGSGAIATQRASARTLPIIVGIGVALGVFGGLMMIRSTGASGGTNEQPQVLSGNDDDDGAEILLGPPDAGAEAVAAVVFDAAPDVETPPEPETRTVTLRFEVSPEDAAIQVDGEGLDDDALPFVLGIDEEKEVRVVARAEGYKRWSETIALPLEGEEKIVEIELEKRSARRPPRRRGRGRGGRGGRGSGGLIDL